MSNDDSMPPQPKTKELPAPDRMDIIANELKALIINTTKSLDNKVAIGFQKSDEKRDLNHQIVMNKFEQHDARLTILEAAKLAHDQRATASSDRVRALHDTTSQHDLEHEAKIAANIIKTEALDTAVHETRAIAEKAWKEISKQSDFMGIGKKGLEWLRSKEARTDAIRVATLIGAVYAALKAAGVIK